MAANVLFDVQTAVGFRPFVSDGTANGTFLLKDVATGRYDNGGVPIFATSGFRPLGNGKFLFTGFDKTDTANQVRVYVTDGTTAGTTEVKVLGAYDNRSLAWAATANGTVTFVIGSSYRGYGPVGTADVWTSDGTAAGTTLLKTLTYTGAAPAPSLMTPLGNGRAIFNVPNTNSDWQLWVTDGTAAGTVVLKDNPVTGSGFYAFTPIGNGRALFAVKDSNVKPDISLYVTDGTTGGTTKILTGNPIGPIVATGTGKFLFQSYDSVNTDRMMITDGTAAGTLPFNLLPGKPIGTYTPVGNGKMTFTTNTNNNTLLYLTDLTTAGTTLLHTFVGSSAAPAEITDLGNGKFIFENGSLNNGYTVWVSDGTAAGTVQVSATVGISGQFSTVGFQPLGNGTALFQAAVAGTGPELYITDGTAAGTKLVRDIYAGVIGSYPTNFTLIPPVVAAPFPFSIVALDAVKMDDTGGTTPYTFTVSRSGDLGQAATVNWTAVGSGANPVPPELFGNPIGAITFAAGVASTTLTINIRGAQIGASEGFTVALAGAPPASTATTSASGTVLGNATLSNDPYFDAAFYLAHYPDILAAGVNALQHYLAFGWKEGRDPSAWFSTSYYLSHNPDVAASGLNPLQQFESLGWKQGRDPSASFSTADYLAANPDVKAASVNPLLHYLQSGKAEGRTAFKPAATPNAGVDPSYYYAHNPDVLAAGLDATTHFLTSGWQEGRNPNALFDTRLYLAQNPDVKAAGIDPLLHFETYGAAEGRTASLLFDGAKYLAAYADVQAAGVNPLLHYISYGQAEGRIAFLTGGAAAADPLIDAAYYDAQLGATLIPTGLAAARQAAWSYDTTGWQTGLNPNAFFNTTYYLSHNPDIAAAHIDPLLHYETYGWKEGRDPSAQFSTTKYLAAYADVKAAGVDPLLHYVAYGQAEGRSASSA